MDLQLSKFYDALAESVGALAEDSIVKVSYWKPEFADLILVSLHLL